MHSTPTVRALLVVSGLLAASIGAAILFAPVAFHATHGVELGRDADLLSEVRAPGAALVALGGLMLVGAFRRASTLASVAVAAAVYLAYGGARVLSMAVDGVPNAGLVGAAAIELALGGACAFVLLRVFVRSLERTPAADGIGEVA